MNIQNILEEIYKLDSDMKKHEKELEKIVATFIEAKPDIKIDEKFVEQLKEKIMTEERHGAMEKNDAKGFVFSLPKLSFALAGAALTLVLMLPFVSFDFSRDNSGISMNEAKDRERIARLDDRAFGSLVGSGESDEQAGVNQESGAPLTTMGGSDGLGAGSDAKISANTMVVGRGGGGAEDMAMDADARMIAPYFDNIEYKYVGEEFTAGEDFQVVYRRSDSTNFGISLGQLLDNAGAGLIDSSRLSNVELQNISLAEDREFGLILNINSREGTINVNRNWLKWPNPTEECRSEQCFLDNRIKLEDVPTDSELIAIADGFLNDYSIDKSVYGEAEVNDYWRKNYEMSDDKANYYFPDNMQVVYPLLVEGEKVYNEDGRPNGLSIDVDIRHKKVSGVYTLRDSNFQSSEYEIETDINRIIKFAESGGNGPLWYQEDVEINTLEAELGTPEKILIINYRYQREKGTNDELFIPALRFPIVKKPEGARYFDREYIVVPIVKEVFEERMQYIDRMPTEPMPMPLPRDGGGDDLPVRIMDEDSEPGASSDSEEVKPETGTMDIMLMPRE